MFEFVYVTDKYPDIILVLIISQYLEALGPYSDFAQQQNYKIVCILS